MILHAYSLHDTKALTYSPPFYANAHGQAVRLVMDLAQTTDNMVGRHPADFALYLVGAFNDQSGELLPATHREHIADVLSLVPKSPAVRDIFTVPSAEGASSNGTSNK